MPIEVHRGLLRYLRRNQSGAYVQVRCNQSSHEIAEAALQAATEDIFRIPHDDELGGSAAKSVDVMSIPSGPILYVDMPDVSSRSHRQVIECVLARVIEAGVDDAVIGYPKERGLFAAEERYASRHDGCGIGPGPKLVVEVDGRPPGKTMPTRWIGPAVDWVLRDDPDVVWFQNVSIEFGIAPTQLRGWLEHGAAWVYGAAAGSITTHVRKVKYSGPFMTLSVAGPDLTGDVLRRETDLLIELGRALAGTYDYAAVDVAASDGGVNDPRYIDRWENEEFLRDFRQDLWPFGMGNSLPFLHPDYFARKGSLGLPRPWLWQCITERLAPFDVLPPEATRLDAGFIELRFGELHDWAERSPELPRIVEHAAKVLSVLPHRRS